MADRWTTLTRDDVNALLAANTKAPHLDSLFEAVRDHGVRLIVVPQTDEPFEAALEEMSSPFLALIADDTDCALGPSEFDEASFARLARMAEGAAVVSCEPRPDVYATMAALPAFYARSVILVETRPEQEIPWIEFLRRVNESLPLLLCTVEGGRA